MYILVTCLLDNQSINQLCLTRVKHNSVQLINSWPSNSRSNWNLEMSVFEEGEKPEEPEKNPRSKARTNNKLNPHMTPGPGIEPGTHWWEASALTTAPPLLPCFFNVRRTGILIRCSPVLPLHTCTCVYSINRLNKLCWSMSENDTKSKWSKSHELKLITRLEHLLSLHYHVLYPGFKT